MCHALTARGTVVDATSSVLNRIAISSIHATEYDSGAFDSTVAAAIAASIAVTPTTQCPVLVMTDSPSPPA